MNSFFKELDQLHNLMRVTLERWALGMVIVSEASFGDQMALADALRDEFLIDHDTHDSLWQLKAWAIRVQDGSGSYSEALQAQNTLEELLELFTQLANSPTLGKRHNAIIPGWMEGDSLAELAESRGVDEQRILVLLYEVVRYYELANLEQLRHFLQTRM
ncbi:MAG: hypothetical protein ACPGWR_32275 [Ardenticatenaceae bacterium]